MEAKEPPVTYLYEWVEKYCIACNISRQDWYLDGELRGRFWYWLKINGAGHHIIPSYTHCCNDRDDDLHGDSIQEP